MEERKKSPVGRWKAFSGLVKKILETREKVCLMLHHKFQGCDVLEKWEILVSIPSWRL